MKSIILLISVFLIHSVNALPSTECNESLSTIESIICRDSELSTLNFKLTQFYSSLVKKTDKNEAWEIKKLQGNLKYTRNKCIENRLTGEKNEIRTCIGEAYQSNYIQLLSRPKTYIYFDSIKIFSNKYSQVEEYWFCLDAQAAQAGCVAGHSQYKRELVKLVFTHTQHSLKIKYNDENDVLIKKWYALQLNNFNALHEFWSHYSTKYCSDTPESLVSFYNEIGCNDEFSSFMIKMMVQFPTIFPVVPSKVGYYK